MIDPGTWAPSWIVRGLALAFASGACYLIARRAGPIAGVSASASGLVLLATLPVLLMLPGPRWDIPIDPALADFRAFADPEPLAMDRGIREPEAIPLDLPPIAFDQVSFDAGPLPSNQPSRPPEPAPVDSIAGLPIASEPLAETPPNLAPSWRSALSFGLLALVLLGLLRLALGLGAVARLRRRGQPIHDPSLLETLDLLRAELSITRPVELREAPGLGTPATIGWRRPVILLPDDWKSWEGGEHRAVLAHELAHIHRGDFPVALVAQLGVALHPYNPLAYWLAGRLRLDQELAADATASRLSGGRRPYLTCLARLALRRDDLASGWPARAFLPVRGTLVRRIEMLRCDRLPDRDAPSRAFRALTVAAITALAFLCVGLRVPETAAARPVQDTPVPEAEPLGDDGFDLSPIPSDAALVAAIRPARLASAPELGALIDEFEPMKRFLGGIDLSIPGLQQLTVVELRRPEPHPGRGSMPIVPDLIIFRTVDPLGDDLASDILANITRNFDAELVSVSFLGTTYQRAREAPLAVLRFDDHTAIVAMREQTIRHLITERNRPRGAPLWLEAAEQVNDGQALIAFETTWLSGFLGPNGPRGASGPFEPIALVGPMLDRASAYAISLDLLDGFSLGAVALCGDEQGAKQVSETATALKTLARNALGNIRGGRTIPPGAEAMLAVFKEVETLLDAASIEAEGSTVRLRAETDHDLAALLRIVAPPIEAARIASRRAQAMNNLKQIGLALHNYHDTYGNFPPPVLVSDNGTAYSWRVAILPFIEGAELYNRYRFDEPWDGPNNLALLDEMPAVFRVPESDSDPTHADYFALVGPQTLLGESVKGTSIRDVTDGTSNTIAIVESKRPTPWTKPEDIPYLPEPFDEPRLPELGGFWAEGFQAAFADGSVRLISHAVDPHILRALITRNGGEVISADQY